mmetsp:Transcript_466/g.726  ORF Transcript_466/g.726 Transcript_466/m.726 type:complete len:189 (-) Transcript_466:92-658(-)|eukprot:CAMPEP_0113644572 /NCGR_PEP_ID=MMETSP0017_2-20120614/23461_1 /TAXON_ID=2856 /ORGANISM="Cylindrotheca closterium" /LENGTH=188 /DNA_ID=CAMNT_0000556195 /DNA_START=68 /DNA_END=634 /DNA_ORIENTATION=+ /assembly_acc=CAM_ASM_000147
MKTQVLFTTLSMAASLATVESFHIPLGKSSSRPSSSLQESSSSSDGFGLRKMSKDLMNQKKEDPTSNDIANRYMSFGSSAPKPLTTSTWKKEDTKQEKESTESLPSDLSRLSQEAVSSTDSDEYPLPTKNIDEWFTTLNELEGRLEQTSKSLDEYAEKHQKLWGESSQTPKRNNSFDDSMYDFEGCWQ